MIGLAFTKTGSFAQVSLLAQVTARGQIYYSSKLQRGLKLSFLASEAQDTESSQKDPKAPQNTVFVMP